MGRRRNKGRPISGVLLLDKPQGISSNAALQKVKRIFDANKAGHTGSLDPLATGMLPICLGEATKMAAYLLDANKRYQTTVRLGFTSTTGDSEGDITTAGQVPALTEDYLNSVLSRFIGKISQVPPMYSALKRNGEPLYKLAQQGIEVEREARIVEIESINLLRFSEDEIELEVSCSKGTYIRTLAEDIGSAMGCGGYVTSLRRLSVGYYDDPSKMITIEQLEDILAAEGLQALDQQLLPVDSALTHWPSVMVSGDMAFFLMRGQSVQISNAPVGDWVKIYKDDNQFLGLGQVETGGKLQPKRLIKH